MKAERLKWCLSYLDIKYPEFVSPTEFGREYGNTFLNNNGSYHSSTGSPVLKKLVDLGWCERNKNGHYRLLKK